MQRIAVATMAAACLLVASARAARAEDNAELKKLVQAEMQAAQDKKKADDAKDGVMRVRWDNGPKLETADKQFSFRFVGRIHLDTVFSDADDFLDGPPPAGVGDGFDSATYFRRVRLGVQVDLGKYVDGTIVVDFADPTFPVFRDAYITLKNLKDCLSCWMPNVRFGQQYEPIGLETVTSDNWLTFIERAAITNLHPERSIGMQFFDSFWHDRATASAGIYSTGLTDDAAGFALWDEDEADGGWAATGRFSVVPWAKDTCHFLHVGASASYREPHEVLYQARPGTGRGARVASTGLISDPQSVLLWNAELGLSWGAFHAAAEYTALSLDAPAVGDPTFSGYTVQAGWFLTGESRGYDWKRGLWGNPKVCCPWLTNNCCCKGLWEVAARYDFLDLNDGTILGGELTTITVGVNWHLNQHARIQFNYVLSTVENRNSLGVVIADADVNSFLMRWDIHF
jgi:phosphate-selective porin OprO/OprP